MAEINQLIDSTSQVIRLPKTLHLWMVEAGFSPRSLLPEPVSLLSMLCRQESLGGTARRTLLPLSAFSFFLPETDISLGAMAAIFHLWGKCEDGCHVFGMAEQRGKGPGSLLISQTAYWPWKTYFQFSTFFKILLFGLSVVSNGSYSKWHTAFQCQSLSELRGWTTFLSMLIPSKCLNPYHSFELQNYISNCLLMSPLGHI